jgi:hypothetical protein
MIYVAGPYSSRWGRLGEFVNILRARRVAMHLWKKGCTVFCPHLNSALMGDLLTYDQWIESGLKFLSKCHEVYMMRGWEKSPGARREHEFAKVHGKVIYYEQGRQV